MGVRIKRLEIRGQEEIYFQAILWHTYTFIIY